LIKIPLFQVDGILSFMFGIRE